MIYQGKRGRRYIIEDSYNDDAELYGKVYSMPYGSKIEAKFSVTSSFETIGVISIFGLITLLVFIYLLDFFTSQESSVDIQPIFIALVLLVAFFVGLIIQKALKSSIEDKVKSILNFLNQLFSEYKIECRGREGEAVDYKNI